MLEPIEKYYRVYGPKLKEALFFDKSENLAERISSMPLNYDHYNCDSGEADVYPPELIDILLSRDDYVDNLLEIFKNKEAKNIIFNNFVSDMRATGLTLRKGQPTYQVRKSSMVKFIIDRLQFLPPESRERGNKIIRYAQENYDATQFLNDHSIFTCEMGNKKVSAPVSKLVNLFVRDFEQADEGIFNFIDSNYQPHEFMYCALQWARQTCFFNQYALPDAAEKFMYRLTHDAIFDFSTVNMLNETKDNFTTNAEYDELLIDWATRDLPKRFNKFQKAALVYLRLCGRLHYDSGFFASNQQGRSAEYHSRIEHLKDINLSAAGVVCYEFQAIYAKTLRELGLNYDYINLYQNYGGGHATLRFKATGFLVEVEPFKGVFNSDPIYVRFEHRVDGFTCLNQNKYSQLRFNEELNDVCDYFFKNEFADSPIAGHYDELKQEYALLSENKTRVSLRDKIALLRKQIPDILLLPGIVRTIYTKWVCDCIFAEERMDGRFDHTIIAEKVDYKDTEYMPASIFTIISKNASGEEIDAKYLKIDHKNKISFVSKEELVKGLEDGKYMRMSESHNIPGISYEVKESGEDD